MLKLLFSPLVAQALSATMVVMAGVIIGRGASRGMSIEQWGYACLILAASILLAVLVWNPDPAAQKTEDRDLFDGFDD